MDMRKKSHISLTRYLIETVNRNELKKHKTAFYIGSILPDCVPSFFIRRHSFEETFDILKEEIRLLTEEYDSKEGVNGYFCRHLGVITHYLADFFTYPHNRCYTGTMKDHCNYEKKLKLRLKEYVQSEEAKEMKTVAITYEEAEEIYRFIQHMHQQYKEGEKAIQEDIHYIVSISYEVVCAILTIVETENRPRKANDWTLEYEM